LLEEKITFHSRDLEKQRLTEAELDGLIGQRDHKEFLNTRNPLRASKPSSLWPESPI
jgi:arsenate reductase-like glutaredoxin family protein